MGMVLGWDGANWLSPNPQWVRDHNSPVWPAMHCQRSHTGDVCRSAGAVNPLVRTYPFAGSKTPPLLFSMAEIPQLGGAEMAKRPIATATEARAGSREGVVRYVLLVSLVLVVVLFIVAYELSS
jgi:hypothetical protein